MKRKITSFFKYAFLTIASVISVFPLYWMISSATNKSVDVIQGKIVPGLFLFENFKALLANQPLLGTSLINSFRNSIVLTAFSLLICSLAGYGFEVYHDKHKDRVMAVLLFSMMVPFAATMIPLFQMVSELNLIGTTIGFILPAISTPVMIMMFRQSARSFPHDIIEASRIDGLNELQIFLRMFIPTMRSTYAAATIIIFMNAWNSYLWPKIIMVTNTSQTMPMLVANLIQGYVIDYGMVMLGVTICTIPTVVVFFLLQKSFAEGITGAVK
ncbi:MAG: carbohydrate ABC transporter permease [Vallitaleaceae bacterium]|nr:carbohydrate ABC transporter permease [Vallitaleaceae bacterium]